MDIDDIGILGYTIWLGGDVWDGNGRNRDLVKCLLFIETIGWFLRSLGRLRDPGLLRSLGRLRGHRLLGRKNIRNIRIGRRILLGQIREVSVTRNFSLRSVFNLILEDFKDELLTIIYVQLVLQVDQVVAFGLRMDRLLLQVDLARNTVPGSNTFMVLLIGSSADHTCLPAETRSKLVMCIETEVAQFEVLLELQHTSIDTQLKERKTIHMHVLETSKGNVWIILQEHLTDLPITFLVDRCSHSLSVRHQICKGLDAQNLVEPVDNILLLDEYVVRDEGDQGNIVIILPEVTLEVDDILRISLVSSINHFLDHSLHFPVQHTALKLERVVGDSDSQCLGQLLRKEMHMFLNILHSLLEVEGDGVESGGNRLIDRHDKCVL